MSALFPDPSPPKIPGIDLLCCGVDEILHASYGTAALVFADPPWGGYTQNPGAANPNDAAKGTAYPTLTYAEIRAHLEAAAYCCQPGARLVLWSTWPLDEEIRAAGIPGKGWTFKSGGAWNKHHHHGPGHHWAGNSEPVRIFVHPGKGYRDTKIPLRSGYTSKPKAHSAKPIDWQRQMIERWTRPDDLVLDLYAGDGTVAVAAMLAGRRYLGAEIDKARHKRALGLLAHHRSTP